MATNHPITRPTQPSTSVATSPGSTPEYIYVAAGTRVWPTPAADSAGAASLLKAIPASTAGPEIDPTRATALSMYARTSHPRSNNEYLALQTLLVAGSVPSFQEANKLIASWLTRNLADVTLAPGLHRLMQLRSADSFIAARALRRFALPGPGLGVNLTDTYRLWADYPKKHDKQPKPASTRTTP